jgi:hypothetical protein
MNHRWDLSRFDPERFSRPELQNHGVWKLVDLPEGKTVIDGLWVYSLKLDGDGNILKYKGCYVAHGDEMVEGRDFEVKWTMVTRCGGYMSGSGIFRARI